MLRCAASFVVAAHPKVRLTPCGFARLACELFTKPSGTRFFTKPLLNMTEQRKSAIIHITVILLLSVMLRVPFLSYPSEVVFDEVGFGKLVTAYGWTGKRLFDIHPPLGKLLITAAGKFGGYAGGIDFSKIGNACSESITPLRLLPALAGSFIPAVVVILLYQLGASWAAALLGGVLMTFDNAFIVQSRVIGLDTLLVFFILSSLSALLAARSAAGKKKIALMLVSGLLSGMAAGIKFTGLAALGLAQVILTDDWLRANKKNRLEGAALAFLFWCAAIAIYLTGWMIHFKLMRYPGEGDAFFVPTGHFFSDLFHLHKIMLVANADITTIHPYSSYWWQWVVMKKPIYYWVHNNDGIYFIGNPVLWWGAGAVFAWMIGYLIFSGARNLTSNMPTGRNYQLWIPIAGFFISILPLVPISRPLFMYHYLPALSFALISGILWLNINGYIRNAGIFEQGIFYYAVIAGAVLMFILLTPITYGLGALSSYQKILGWTGFGP